MVEAGLEIAEAGLGIAAVVEVVPETVVVEVVPGTVVVGAAQKIIEFTPKTIQLLLWDLESEFSFMIL